jgi:hypothetical protein
MEQRLRLAMMLGLKYASSKSLRKAFLSRLDTDTTSPSSETGST